jgi:hypothetical protein
VKFFRNPKKQCYVSCEDVIGAFSELVQRKPSGGSHTDLPYDTELIKASLIHTAKKIGTPEAIDVARSGFLLLIGFIGMTRKLDIAATGEERLLASLNEEQDMLLNEFDSRFNLAMRLQNA